MCGFCGFRYRSQKKSYRSPDWNFCVICFCPRVVVKLRPTMEKSWIFVNCQIVTWQICYQHTFDIVENVENVIYRCWKNVENFSTFIFMLKTHFQHVENFFNISIFVTGHTPERPWELVWAIVNHRKLWSVFCRVETCWNRFWGVYLAF